MQQKLINSQTNSFIRASSKFDKLVLALENIIENNNYDNRKFIRLLSLIKKTIEKHEITDKLPNDSAELINKKTQRKNKLVSCLDIIKNNKNRKYNAQIDILIFKITLLIEDKDGWANNFYKKNYETLNKAFPYKRLKEKHANETLNQVFDLIKNGLIKNRNIKILELGCGTGNITTAIANNLYKNNINFNITALDYSDYFLLLAKEKINDKDYKKDIAFIKGDLSKKYFGLNNENKNYYDRDSYDLIIMNNVLYIFEDNIKNNILTNIYKLLQENGRFILSDAKIDKKLNFTEELICKAKLDLLKIRMLLQHVIHDSLARLLVNMQKIEKLFTGEKELAKNRHMISTPKQIELLSKTGFTIEKSGMAYTGINTYFVGSKNIYKKEDVYNIIGGIVPSNELFLPVSANSSIDDQYLKPRKNIMQLIDKKIKDKDIKQELYNLLNNQKEEPIEEISDPYIFWKKVIINNIKRLGFVASGFGVIQLVKMFLF